MRRALGKLVFICMLALCAACLIVFAFLGRSSASDVSVKILTAEDAPSVLDQLKENKIDLNTADVDTLTLIPAITSSMANKIVSFREAWGRFYSVYDLLDIEGFTDELLIACSDYLKVGGL